MATLTADRHLAQRSLLDPHEEEHTPTPTPTPRPPQPRVAASAGPTLDDLVAGTWDALVVTHAASCLVCGEDLTPRFSSGPHPVAAVCRGCGADFS
jgi:3-oxoacyl-ACP reductase-like protein